MSRDNVGDFAQQLDTTVAAALAAILNELPEPTLRRGTLGGRLRGAGDSAYRGVETMDGVEAGGNSGRVRASGIRIPFPAPSRYELTLDFDGFAAAQGLVPTGTLEFNFVSSSSASGADVGLYRGALSLSGPFSGAVDVGGYVAGGVLSSLNVTSGDTEMVVGAGAPPAATANG